MINQSDSDLLWNIDKWFGDLRGRHHVAIHQFYSQDRLFDCVNVLESLVLSVSHNIKDAPDDLEELDTIKGLLNGKDKINKAYNKVVARKELRLFITRLYAKLKKAGLMERVERDPHQSATELA